MTLHDMLAARPGERVEVLILRPDMTVDRAEAFATVTPGLAVLQLRVGVHAGEWVLVHVPTGMAVPRVFTGAEQAQAGAAAARGLLDWTQIPAHDVLAETLQRLVVELHRLGAERAEFFVASVHQYTPIHDTDEHAEETSY